MSDDSADSLRAIAASIGVPVARRHIFLCCEQTKPKCCDMERGVAAWEFLKRRLKERGLSEQGGILRTNSDRTYQVPHRRSSLHRECPLRYDVRDFQSKSLHPGE